MAAARALLTIVAHPQPRKGETYWTREKILALGRAPDGIEIYNGHYGIPRMTAGGTQPQYTDFWDRLLTSGIRTWGFANDDFHDPADFNNAWTMVLVEEPTAAAVARAAKSGRCYGTTGLLLEEVGEADGRIAVATQSPCIGRFVGPGGRTLSEQAGRRFEYAAREEAYVRFEAEGDAGKLFLQPMFRG
jgi:hypothetical protein